MHRHRIAPLLLSALLAATTVSARETAPRSTAEFVPKSAVAIVTLRDGDRRLADIREWFESSGLLESEAAQDALNSPQLLQAKLMATGLATSAGVDLWAALGAPLGRELTLAVRPGGGRGPKVLLVISPRDEALADRLLELAAALAGANRPKKAAPDKPRMIDGIEIHAYGPELLQCKIDGVFVLANDESLMSSAIAASKGRDPLASSKQYAEAVKQVPDEAAAFAWLNMTAIREFVPADKLPEKLDNPLGGFLFGGWWRQIRGSDGAVAWATADAQGLSVELRVKAESPLPETHRGFSPKNHRTPTWSSVDLPRSLAEIQVSRDWAALFAEREALLSLSAASDLVNFSTTLSTVLGGMDFVADVLSPIDGPLRLIAADQDFSAAAILPSPKLPAFALVMPIDSARAEKLGPRLYSGTQMAISLVNLQLSQQNQPTYMVDVDRYRDVREIFTTFAEPPATAAMDMGPGSQPAMEGAAPHGNVRHNFLPAAAFVEGEYVVASTRQLLHDIIDRAIDAKKTPAKPAGAAKTGDSLRIDGKALAGIFRKNRGELVTNRMLEEDKPKAQAQRDIDLFLTLLERIDGLRLSAESDKVGFAGRFELALRAAGK